MNITKTNRRNYAAALIVAAVMMPQLAMAQTTGTTLEPVNTIANTVLGFMTGAFARTAGAVAVAFIGYRWFTGRMEMGRAAAVIMGIVLVLGAPAVVSFIGTGIGGTGAPAAP